MVLKRLQVSFLYSLTAVIYTSVFVSALEFHYPAYIHLSACFYLSHKGQYYIHKMASFCEAFMSVKSLDSFLPVFTFSNSITNICPILKSGNSKIGNCRPTAIVCFCRSTQIYFVKLHIQPC